MSKLPRLTGKELCKLVEKLGFEFNNQTGSHITYKHSDGRITTIPVHAGEEIGQWLLLKIIKQDLQLTRQEFEKLVKEN